MDYNDFTNPWVWVVLVILTIAHIGLITFVVYHVRMWAKELGDPFSHISKEPEAIRGQVLDVIPEALTLVTAPDRVT